MREARTPKQVLWEACGWLVSEAWRAGPDHLRRATDAVLAKVHEIRKEARS
jgi:hypothetical protein